jgi:hypothetical protein
MAEKNWLTAFTGASPVQDPDPITDVMPDLDDVSAPGAADGDDVLSSQVEALRDKLDAICKLVGDSVNDPNGSICDILDRSHSGGDAQWLRFSERPSAPTGSAGLSYAYALDDGGITKLYVKWSDDTQVELGGGGQTDTVTGSNGITNSGNNVDANLVPTYGSSANTICEGNDSRLSDARTPTSHASSHQNGGSDEVATETPAINSIPKTGASSTLGGGWIPYGSIASTACEGNDARLSDARTPVSHASEHEPGGGDAMAVDAAVATGSLRTLGTGAQQACAGNDSRLSDARTPTSHASSHQHGGADEVATATPAANVIPKTGSGGTLDGGFVPYGSIASTACEGNDSRLSDARTPTSHAASHQSGGGDSIKLDDLAAPDDNTDLNVSTSAHGLCPKLSGIASDGLKGDGSFGPVSPLSTKGDLYGYSSVPARLPVGSDNQIIRASSSSALGVRWANEQQAHEQVYTGSGSGITDIQLDYLAYGSGDLDTPSGYDLLVFRDGVKMTYAGVPAASDEYWYNETLNQVRVLGDGSSHRWEVYYKSIADSVYTGGASATYGTATFGTATFDPAVDVSEATYGTATFGTDTFDG